MPNYIPSAIAVFMLLNSLDGHAVEVNERIELGEEVCSYLGEDIPNNIYTFSSDSDADSVIEDILNVSGLPQNFTVKAAGVPNASAVVIGSERFILYNQSFIETIKDKTGSRWSAYSIMAHEIGHHLSGHTLSNEGSRPNIELEADRYSGFILQKLGASLNDATRVITNFGSLNASDTHPAKHDRLAAISNGWIASCELNSDCRRTISNSTSVETERLVKKITPQSRYAGLNPKAVTRLQEVLTWRNCNPGPIDGDFGKQTQTALKRFLSLNSILRNRVEKEKQSLHLYKNRRDWWYLELVSNIASTKSQTERSCP